MPIRILLADNHIVVRQGLRALFERQGYQVVGEASDGQELIKMAPKVNAEIAVVDVSMAFLNGLDAARELHKICPKLKVIMLTRHDEDQYVTEALRSGVKGYVLKNQPADELVSAIQQVYRGGTYLSPSISGTVVEAYLNKSNLPTDPLSPRERQVLQLIGEGKSTREVAILLGISAKTAESHRARLMQKLDIHETASLVRYAIRQGLIQA